MVRTKRKVDPQVQAILDYLRAEAPEAVLIDGHDDAIVGLLDGFDLGDNQILVYDRAQIVATLAKDMSLEDAEEYFEVNVRGAYVGKNTPVFVDPLWKLVRPVRATPRVRKG